MAKRNDAVAAIANLNDLAIGDTEKRDRIIASIPTPHFQEHIKRSRVYSDKTFNVRDESSYSFEENKALYKSLAENGLMMRGSDNMSFSIQDDGRILVIGGNLRYWMMDAIDADVLKRRIEANEPTGDLHPLPFDEVFGLVFEGLTREQEVYLMADHALKKGLTEFEWCKEIGEACHNLGLTDKDAASIYGFTKTSISRHRMRYNMPRVFAEYRKEKGKDKNIPFVKVGQEALHALYTCYLADQKAGCPFRVEGLNFDKAWNDFLKNPESIGKRETAIKPKDRDTILNNAKSYPAMFGNTPEVQAIVDTLNFAGNEGIVNMQVVVAELVEYCSTLRKDRESALAQLEGVQHRLADALATIASLEGDVQSAVDHINDLESELKTLQESK